MAEPKEEIINALNDKQNKYHKDIISTIIEFMPNNKKNDCFAFICKGAAKTPISRELNKQILDALLREDDVETVNDAGDIENLKMVGDIITTIDLKYVANKYPSIIEDTSNSLFAELTENYSSSPAYRGLIVKMLNLYDNNSLDKIYDKCKEYIVTDEENVTDDESDIDTASQNNNQTNTDTEQNNS